MAYKYAYNPTNSFLDIIGKSSAADGGGGKFVGVTAMYAVGTGNWVRIAQIQCTCDDISSEAQKQNICFDGVFYLTKQNASPYTHEYIHKAGQLDVHIQIPYITDLSNSSNHYSRVYIGLTDCIGFDSHDIEIVETAHVVSGTKAYAYFSLYAQVNTTYDRYFFSYVTNASKDQYNRIKIIPGSDYAETIPYGTGLRVYATPYRAEYTQSISNVTSVQIVHNLNTYPNVVIFDENGKQVLADVTFTDLNTLTVTFSESFTGTIYCK